MRLLEAGRRLADRTGTAALDPQSVCEEAGLKPLTFQRQFATPSAFRRELMDYLADEVRESVGKLTLNMPAGLSRLKLAIDAYLAANLERRALRELVLALRVEPEGAESIRRRMTAFLMMAELEFKSIGVARAPALARLATAAVIETTWAEYEARAPLPEFRRTLYDWLDRVAVP